MGACIYPFLEISGHHFTHFTSSNVLSASPACATGNSLQAYAGALSHSQQLSTQRLFPMLDHIRCSSGRTTSSSWVGKKLGSILTRFSIGLQRCPKQAGDTCAWRMCPKLNVGLFRRLLRHRPQNLGTCAREVKRFKCFAQLLSIGRSNHHECLVHANVRHHQCQKRHAYKPSRAQPLHDSCNRLVQNQPAYHQLPPATSH